MYLFLHFQVFALAPLVNLRTLHLSTNCAEVTVQGLGALASQNKQITSLELYRCIDIGNQTGNGLKALAPLNLTHLALTDCTMTNAGMSTLVESQASTLTSLELKLGTAMTDQGIALLSSLSKLSNLGLEMCRSVTDNGVQSLAHATKLTQLNLRFCDVTNTALLRTISRLSTLTELSLASTQITNEGMHGLARLTLLRQLDLEGCKKVTWEGLRRLSPLQQLNHFRAPEGCSYREVEALRNASLLNLTSLSLCRSPLIAVTSVEHGVCTSLAAFPQLTSLDLSFCTVTENGLQHIMQLTSLTQLDLNGCPIFHTDMRRIFALLRQTMPNLRDSSGDRYSKF